MVECVFTRFESIRFTHGARQKSPGETSSSNLFDEILVPLTKAGTTVRIEEILELIEGERPVTEL